MKVVRSKKVPSEIIESSSNLELIIRAGVGYDNIDTKAATKKGVRVENVPGKNVHAVSELVMAMIFSFDRQVHLMDQLSKKGEWDKAGFSKAKGLRYRVVGIVGLGKIGINVAKTCLAIGMKVVYFSLGVKPGTKLYVFGEECKQLFCEAVTYDVLLKESDIISLHIPFTEKTKNMINKSSLNKMKKDVILINTARGGVINEQELIEHMNNNKKFRFGCDVFQNEPSVKKGKFNSVLVKHPHVLSTHHIGAGTDQASFAVGTGLYNQLKMYVENNKIVNCVNFASAKL